MHIKILNQKVFDFYKDSIAKVDNLFRYEK